MPLPPTADLAQRDTERLVSTGRLKAPVRNNGLIEVDVPSAQAGGRRYRAAALLRE